MRTSQNIELKPKSLNFLPLQSVSANFTRSISELYSEIDKWAGNFVTTFRNSEAISELRFEIRKFKLRVYVPRNIKDIGEKT